MFVYLYRRSNKENMKHQVQEWAIPKTIVSSKSQKTDLEKTGDTKFKVRTRRKKCGKFCRLIFLWKRIFGLCADGLFLHLVFHMIVSFRGLCFRKKDNSYSKLILPVRWRGQDFQFSARWYIDDHHHTGELVGCMFRKCDTCWNTGCIRCWSGSMFCCCQCHHRGEVHEVLSLCRDENNNDEIFSYLILLKWNSPGQHHLIAIYNHVGQSLIRLVDDFKAI